VEKYGIAGNATDDNIMRRRNDRNSMPDNNGKNTDTHSRRLIIIALHGKNCYENMPRCHIVGRVEYSSNWIQALTVPMHLSLKTDPLCPIL